MEEEEEEEKVQTLMDMALKTHAVSASASQINQSLASTLHLIEVLILVMRVLAYDYCLRVRVGV